MSLLTSFQSSKNAKSIKRFGLVLLIVGIYVPATVAVTGVAYFTDGTVLYQVDLDGQNLVTILPGEVLGCNYLYLTHDARQRMLYFSDVCITPSGTSSLHRMPVDFTSFETIRYAAGESLLYGVALDVEHEKVYWTLKTGQSVFPADAGLIQRANLDGSGAETLTDSAGAKLGGLRVDTIAGRVYWATFLPGSSGSGAIRRVGLGGQSLEDVITGLSEPRDVALDLGGGKVYWTDSGTGKIQRANVADGANVEDLITGLSLPFALDLDTASGKMYWADAGGMIQRANLDGSNAETLVSGLGGPTGIVVVTQTPTNAYSHGNPNRFTVLVRPNVDGPGSTFVVSLPRDGLVSVGIYNVAGQRMLELVGGNRAAGVHRLSWPALDMNGNVVPTGVYFFRARFDNEHREGKVLIIP